MRQRTKAPARRSRSGRRLCRSYPETASSELQYSESEARCAVDAGIGAVSEELPLRGVRGELRRPEERCRCLRVAPEAGEQVAPHRVERPKQHDVARGRVRVLGPACGRRSSGQTVDAHLEILVLTIRSDDRFDELGHRLNRGTLPDTDADPVIVRRRMNGEREPIRQASGDGFALSLREPRRIGDAVKLR